MPYYKIFFSILAFLLCFSLFAEAQSETDEVYTPHYSDFYPSTISIDQAAENFVIVKDGISYLLPKIEVKRVSQQWNKQKQPEIKLVESFSNILLQVNEMLSLSHKLGFRIRDPKHLDLYREAASWLGTRYRWAGSSSKGVDCSGLTNILMKKAYDKDLDRSSHIIANKLKETLDVENLQPGDLVFFSTMRRKSISHVGVYLGDGHFIHAARKGVIVSNLNESYYSRTLRKAGRI